MAYQSIVFLPHLPRIQPVALAYDVMDLSFKLTRDR